MGIQDLFDQPNPSSSAQFECNKLYMQKVSYLRLMRIYLFLKIYDFYSVLSVVFESSMHIAQYSQISPQQYFSITMFNQNVFPNFAESTLWIVIMWFFLLQDKTEYNRRVKEQAKRYPALL